MSSLKEIKTIKQDEQTSKKKSVFKHA